MARKAGPRAEPKLEGDLPPYLRPLHRLVGTWNVTLRWSEATHRLVGGPREVDAEAEISWLPSGYILHYRLGPSHWLISRDELAREFTVIYTDDRPVSRVYRMTFERRVWKMWRDAPGLRQRFEGRLRPDGQRIVSHWDKCEDGKHWVRDFDLVFDRADSDPPRG